MQFRGCRRRAAGRRTLAQAKLRGEQRVAREGLLERLAETPAVRQPARVLVVVWISVVNCFAEDLNFKGRSHEVEAAHRLHFLFVSGLTFPVSM